ncbi:uncharacterized protein LOC136030003 isoform X2 [Artemia franciscana]|uniref:uncharacterized protein LOC136030003 isoform X2 n=1 Tax=Artemia franciscana TaxID=6661 RepID=UPI0032DA8ADC
MSDCNLKTPPGRFYTGAKQKEDENLHRQLEETRVAVEKEKSSVKKEEEEIVLLKQTLEKLKAQQDELTNKVSICKEKIGDAEKELVSLHKEIHDRETAPLSEKSQLDFLRGLSRCKIVTTPEESAIKGYVVRRKGMESNELRTFNFDTAKEPKHYILNRLWNLIEWSYEEDLKLYL